MSGRTRLADLIRDGRLKSGRTQEAFAKELGATQPTVSDWESGEHTPTMANLRNIARVLDLDPAELFEAATDEQAVA